MGRKSTSLSHSHFNRLGIPRHKDGNRLGLGARTAMYQASLPAEMPRELPPREEAAPKLHDGVRARTGMELFLSSKLAQR